MPTIITRKLTIRAPIEAVWAALTDPKAIGAWMGDRQVKSTRRRGGRYAYFDGATTGTYTEYARPARLAYTWRQQEWPKAWADSRVRWDLKAKGAFTQVRLSHTGFPNQAERDGHDHGWDAYWLTPMQKWLEGSNE